MNDQANTTAYPELAADASHADPGVGTFFAELYAAKNSGSAERFASWFSDDLRTYPAATLGWENRSHAALKAGLEQFMARWGGVRAYPTRIVGGPESAIVVFADTPELFGDEIHGLGAVDIRDGKVVRWVGYWDSTTFDRATLGSVLVPDEHCPSDFRSGDLRNGVDDAIRASIEALHVALKAADGEAAAALFTLAARFEDLALRTLVTGQAAIARYIGLMIDAPYGAGSEIRHVHGGQTGGGYEWTASRSSNVRAGITAIELDRHGRISRLTTLYDAARLAPDLRRDLILRGQDF